jgi:hypothetical protein
VNIVPLSAGFTGKASLSVEMNFAPKTLTTSYASGKIMTAQDLVGGSAVVEFANIVDSSRTWDLQFGFFSIRLRNGQQIYWIPTFSFKHQADLSRYICDLK